MSLQTASDVLVFVAVPAVTLFPILYATTAPWYRTLTGWAVVTAKVGLAFLVDAAAAFRLWGPHYAYREYVVLAAFSVIVLGSWLYLIAFVRVQYLKLYRKERS